MKHSINIILMVSLLTGCNDPKDTLKPVTDSTEINNIRNSPADTLLKIYNIDTNTKKIVNNPLAKGHLNPANNFYVLTSNQKGPALKDYIPWIISIVSILIAWYVLKREGRYKNLNFLSEIDKMLVNDPELWAIYNENNSKYKSIIAKENESKVEIRTEFLLRLGRNSSITITGIFILELKNGFIKATFDGQREKLLHARDRIEVRNAAVITTDRESTVSIRGNPKLSFNGEIGIGSCGEWIKKLPDKDDFNFEGKIRAFCYYKLNNFDLVFRHTNRYSFTYDTWENYMINTMVHSDNFMDVINKETKNYIYGDKYKKKLLELKKTAEKIKELGDKPDDDKEVTQLLINKSGKSKFLNFIHKNFYSM